MRRSSAPKMARDLLPAARTGIKPGSHSVFNTLILDDDPMDGSRSLRKRKSESSDAEMLTDEQLKRRRTSTVSFKAEDSARVAKRSAQSGGGTLDNGEAEVTGDDASSRTIRVRRTQRPAGIFARVIEHSDEPKSLIIAIPISTAALDMVEKNAQKKQRRRERDRERRARQSHGHSLMPEDMAPPPLPHYPAIATTMYANPFFPFPEHQLDELKGKPYGGILTDAEADTSKTYPQQADREIFEAARRKAEEDWRKKTEAQVSETPGKVKSSGPPSKIKCINFGNREIDTWHAAPYPEEYSRNRVLYICEFCLKYMSSDFVAWRHKVWNYGLILLLSSLTIYSSNVLQDILPAMKYIEALSATQRRRNNLRFPSSRSMADEILSTVRTSVFSQSFSSVRRRSTTTSSLFSFTS